MSPRIGAEGNIMKESCMRLERFIAKSRCAVFLELHQDSDGGALRAIPKHVITPRAKERDKLPYRRVAVDIDKRLQDQRRCLPPCFCRFQCHL